MKLDILMIAAHSDYEDPTATYISSPDFLKILEGQARDCGKYINMAFAEGFTCRRLLGVDDLFHALSRKRRQ